MLARRQPRPPLLLRHQRIESRAGAVDLRSRKSRGHAGQRGGGGGGVGALLARFGLTRCVNSTEQYQDSTNLSSPSVYTDATFLYIDATDETHEGVWFSSFANSQLTYLPWLAHEPNGGTTENCLALTFPSMGFVDVRCDSSHTALCEYECK